MNRQILFFDIDGTLVDSTTHIVPASTAAADVYKRQHIAVTYFLLNFIINECLFNVNTFQGIHWNPTDIILNRKRKRNGYIPFLRIINIILLLQL